MGLLEAKVKSALSGDTLILHNVHNPSQERTLSLAFVSAPRLRREGDEPGAFEARDFLRKHVVGRVVTFQVLYTVPGNNKREYGIVHVPSGPHFPDASVAEGWVKLRNDAARKDDSDESAAILRRLESLEGGAKSTGSGLWAADGVPSVECSSEPSEPQALVEEWKGKPIEAIVEKVLSGDRLVARMILEPSKHLQTILLVAGIRCPSTKRTNTSDGKEQAAEPFAEEAQQFVETRLLQRNASVLLLGQNPQGQLIGVVKHPVHGSIAPYLLKAGLGRCADHHTTLLGADMAVLRRAEKEARDNRVGVFRGLVAPKTAAGNEGDFIVSKIQTGDTMYVRSKAGGEKRVSLSSVRQPKSADPKQAPWIAEVKEFLRKKLIGKHVKLVVDGKRAAQEGYDEREMVTVSHANKNIAQVLVENGYVSVIRHRQDDSDRSPIYDDLLMAEKAAQEGGKGMWGAKAPTAKKYVDYSETAEKAKRHLTLLSRQKKVPAMVDFVKSGSRFTVFVPRDDAKMTVVLSGIRAPRSARNANEKSEPFGQEAHEFANRRCLQRDVELDVDDVDKTGGFIGSIYVNRENFARLLVEEGLATVHAYSAEKSGHASDLYAAEKKAKEGRKGMWHDWDPSKDDNDNDDNDDTNRPHNNHHHNNRSDKNAATGQSHGQSGANGALTGSAAKDSTSTTNGEASEASPERKLDYRDVLVTHIDETGRLKVQQIGSGTSALTELMASFRSFHLNQANAGALPGPPKTGDTVAARFTADDEWYRAKVRRNDREKQRSEVVYIDYGNSETVPWSRLRALSQPQFSTQKLKGQAVDASLSYVQLPAAPHYLADSIAFLAERTDGRQLVAAVDQVADLLSLTLFDPAVSKRVESSINADLVADGLAMVPRKLKGWERGPAAAEVLAALRKREEEAKHERKGMWEYGDITEDD